MFRDYVSIKHDMIKTARFRGIRQQVLLVEDR